MIVSDFILFAVFGILFCLESVMLSGRGTVVIYSHLLNRWEYYISKDLPFFGGKNFSLKTLFPPLGAAFITGSHPVIVSPSGFMLNPNGILYSDAIKKSYRYSDVETIGVSGSTLLINGKKFCRMNNESETLWWKEKLIFLIKVYPDKREDAVDEFIKSTFDQDAAEQFTKKIFCAVKPLRISANLLYICLFIAAPLMVLLLSLDNVLLPLFAVILILHIAAVTFFYRAYRSVFDARGIPWPIIISIALYPPALIRSVDYFFQHSMLHFNASVLSLTLLPERDAEKIISFLKREYIYFHFNSEDNFEEEMISYYRSSMLNGIKLLLEKSSINYNELLTPPDQYDNISLYCPRCFCQYIEGTQMCEDCSIDLIKY